MVGATVFSTFDMTQAYHQIALHPEERERSAFRTPFGHYQYRVMPFGLTNAPVVFQTAMSRLFADLPYVVVYLDDILVFSRTPEEHADHCAVEHPHLRPNVVVRDGDGYLIYFVKRKIN